MLVTRPEECLFEWYGSVPHIAILAHLHEFPLKSLNLTLVESSTVLQTCYCHSSRSGEVMVHVAHAGPALCGDCVRLLKLRYPCYLVKEVRWDPKNYECGRVKYNEWITRVFL